MENKAKLWRIAQLDNMEMLSGCFSSQIFPWHSHDTYCLSVIENGVETLEIAGKKLTALPGSILFIPPELLHSNYAYNVQGYKLRTFYINQEVLGYIFSNKNLLKTNLSLSYLINSTPLYNSLVTIHKLIEQSHPGISFKENFFDTIRKLGDLLITSQGIDPSSPKIEGISSQLLPFIEKHLSDKIKLQELASLTKISRFQLVRFFKNETGVTPFEYILQRRIELAKKRLRNGDPIVTTALESGFYDQAHFSHYFKRYVGVTPLAYQKACNILQDF